MSNIIAIHDLSLWSKSSLSLAIPVLEAMGHEVFSLPTALLSTQSDGYEELEKIDLSGELMRFYERIKSYGYKFDAVYSGYLGNSETVKSVERIIDEERAFTLIDPVLGDGGRLYQGMEKENVDALRRLVRKADVITPNMTEASILTETDMKASYSNSDISMIVGLLENIGPEKGVITSVPLALGRLSNVAYDGDDIRIFSFEDEGISYPGSGDLFASLFLSLLFKGSSFFPSVKISGEITSSAVKYSKDIRRERRLGVTLSSVMSEIRERKL